MEYATLPHPWIPRGRQMKPKIQMSKSFDVTPSGVQAQFCVTSCFRQSSYTAIRSISIADHLPFFALKHLTFTPLDKHWPSIITHKQFVYNQGASYSHPKACWISHGVNLTLGFWHLTFMTSTAPTLWFSHSVFCILYSVFFPSIS